MIAHQVRLFLVALQFYTRVPVAGRLGAWVGWQPEWIAHCTRYLPLVGMLVGLAISVVYVAAALVFPHGVAVLLALAAGMLLTGAFHEDGFADFCDGFGSWSGRERTLEIMQDSRVGAFGAIGLVMLMLLKIETLASIDPSWIAVSLISAHGFSRGCAVLVMVLLPYARQDDMSKVKPVAQNLRAIDALAGIGFALLALAGGIWLTRAAFVFAVAALAALAGTAVLVRMMRRRIHGYTGDCLGAVQQVAETAFFLGILATLEIAEEIPPDEL